MTRATSRIPVLFEAIVAERRAAAARRAEGLAANNGALLEARRRAFAERDRAKIVTDRAAVRAKLLQATPPVGAQDGPRKTWTEMRLLGNEFSKVRRFTPVRQLLARAGRAIQTLKPCFMMSPLSLAKFVAAGNLEFDLLVIDEASQMRPEDALGGMLRTKQIVVVGDPKQLPPTDFFARAETSTGTQDDDDDDIDAEFDSGSLREDLSRAQATQMALSQPLRESHRLLEPRVLRRQPDHISDGATWRFFSRARARRWHIPRAA